MTAVGVGQQGSQAVVSGFESLPCQKILRFIPYSFRYSKLVKHKRVLLRKFSALWDKKFSTENLDTPPSLIQTFSVPEISDILKGSATKVFGTSRQKFSTENLDTPPPPLLRKFSVTKISETLKGSPTKIFGTARQRTFDGKSWCSPLSYPNFFGTRN